MCLYTHLIVHKSPLVASTHARDVHVHDGECLPVVSDDPGPVGRIRAALHIGHEEDLVLEKSMTLASEYNVHSLD